MPRLWLEVLGVFSLASILVLNVILNYDSEFVITTIAIFGVSAIKILPGLSRVLSSVQFLNHYAPVIKITIDELINAKVPIAKNTAITNKDGINSQFKFEKFLDVKDLNFS